MSFTLSLHRWFGFQMLPGYIGTGGCVPVYAPVFVQRVQAFKTGRGEMEVSYFNPLYAHGVQQFDVCLRVLLRAEGYLLARLENDVGGANARRGFLPRGI